MSAGLRLAGFFGYDREVVQQLPVEQARRVVLVGATCALPCIWTGVGVGYAAWLAAGAATVDLALGVAVGLASAGTVTNLLKVTIAGGGIAPHLSGDLTTWRPNWAPVVFMALLGAAIAQPFHILVTSSTLDARVAELRVSVVQMHRAAMLSALETERTEATADVAALEARLGTIGEQRARAVQQLGDLDHAPAASSVRAAFVEALTSADEESAGLTAELSVARAKLASVGTKEADAEPEIAAYAAHLEACAFLADRIRIAWETPFLPLAWTLFGAGLTCSPLVLRELSVGGYARALQAGQRDALIRHGVAVSDAVDRMLTSAHGNWRDTAGKVRSGSYVGRPPARFVDPPFDTVPVDLFGGSAKRTGSAKDAADALFALLPRQE